MVESSDKMRFTGGGNSKPILHSCLENLMNSMKKQKYMTLKDEAPQVSQFSRSVVSDFLWSHGLQYARPPCPLQLLELTQIHVHRVSDIIWPSHPLSSPSPPAFNLYQHQGLFKWISSSHQVAIVLELQLQHQSFQWIFRTDFLEDGLVGSPCCPRDSQESSPTPQFKSINSLALSFLCSPALTSLHDYWKNHSFD